MDEFQEQLEAQEWRVAKSMPTIPHSYTLRRLWDDSVGAGLSFSEAIQRIRDDGRPAVWRRMKPKPYLTLGGHNYWTMPSATLDEVGCLNRELVEISTIRFVD
jgi:hypothetical protein